MEYKIKLGVTQELRIVKKTDFGVYLNIVGGKDEDKILLPKKQVPEGKQMGDSINVFVYKDSEDRMIATTLKPAVEVGGLAKLRVKQLTKIGAFLDWGLPKDLLLPFKEQTYPLQENDEVLIYLYVAKSGRDRNGGRLCATMKVYDYLSTDSPYAKDDHVTGIIYEIIKEMGAFVAVDDKYAGYIPLSDIYDTTKAGDVVTARVDEVREDGKLTLKLREKAYIQMDTDSALIYEKLTAAGGHLPYHDKTAPEVIKKEFGLSKNAFKRAIGRLYKEGKISLSDEGIDTRFNE